MKIKFLFALLTVALVSGFWWYQSTANICPVPLSYRIGNVAEGFSLSKEEAKKYALQAEKIWEDEMGRDLFTYDDNSGFLINFVFDNRQAGSDLEASKRTELDRQKVENNRLIDVVKDIQKKYENLVADYSERRAKYEANLEEYNKTVRQHNDRGGAPSDVHAGLEEQQISLGREMERLNKMATELNDLVAELNRVQDKTNRQIADYNKAVDQYNKQFGYAHEFTQGDYRGREINVYKFSDEKELTSVLAHEFGHALGIGHVEGESSLMYYLMGDDSSTPEISEEDKKAYLEICGEDETIGQRIRGLVRNILIKI